MAMRRWVQLPTQWILKDKGLTWFRWGGLDGAGADNVAALILLLVIAHHAEEETGRAEITYDEIEKVAGLSRAKISKALGILEQRGLVTRKVGGRSFFQLAGYGMPPWAKLPAKHLYAAGKITAFRDLSLRQRSQLDALKVYLLVAAFRSNETNVANISYDVIEDYTGIDRNRVKAATSVLASWSMVYIDHKPSTNNPYGVANAYRLPGLDSFNHAGTTGRADLMSMFGTSTKITEVEM